MSSIRVVIKLQDLDTELRSRRTLQEDIKRRLEDVAHLEMLREGVAALRQQLVGLEQRQRSDEWEVDAVRQQMQELEKKLYGGTIRNPKDLVGLEHEVSTVKAREKEQEDRLLAFMTQLEEQRGELLQASEELETAETLRQEQEQELTTQLRQLDDEIGTLGTQRNVLISQVPSRDLALYESLLLSKQGRALARLERGTCQGCRINIPTTVQQRVRSDQTLVQCPSCSRILYA